MAIEDKIKLVFKGILFYTTAIAAMLFICGVDGICDKGYLTESIIIIAGMIYACYKYITEEEYNIILLGKYLDIPEEDDEWN